MHFVIFLLCVFNKVLTFLTFDFLLSLPVCDMGHVVFDFRMAFDTVVFLG